MRSLLVLSVLLLLAAPLYAQEAGTTSASAPTALAGERLFPLWPADSASTVGQRIGRMILPASLGSGLGLVAGLYVGSGPFFEATGCCGGGDDPGLTSGIFGAMLGSAVGSSAGAYLTNTREHPVSYSQALWGGLVGILPGLGGAYLGGSVGDFQGVLAGYVLAQGLTTALIAAAR